jgi:hypothetical protein
MKPENINNPKVTKAANITRIKLREKLEDKVAVLNPIDNSNRYRQLQGQLIRLDKKIAVYDATQTKG